MQNFKACLCVAKNVSLKFPSELKQKILAFSNHELKISVK